MQIKIKKEMLSLKCKACGAVSEVDPRHKLNGFILKNPPENKLSKEEKRCVCGGRSGWNNLSREEKRCGG